MGRILFTSFFSIYLTVIILLGTAAHQSQEIGQFRNSRALSNEPISEQIKVNSLRPLFAEINFSGFQQIIIHPLKVLEKNRATFLKNQESKFSVEWKVAVLQTMSMELSLSLSKIIFPFHFFW